jgi:hypothetical protein
MTGVLLYFHESFFIIDWILIYVLSTKTTFYQLLVQAFTIKFAELWTGNNLSVNITQVKLKCICS